MRSLTQRAAIISATALLITGCADFMPSGPLIGPHPASMARIDQQNMQLRNVPAPSRRVTVAVYDFPDLTGQHRERENVQTLSRAVSQGAAPMLIHALRDAGEGRWFSVLDRSALDNLLRERQIATEMRRIYRGEELPDPSAIPPLHHAGVILQGAIVGYDHSTHTGGFGARYLGIGGDTRWNLDIVTVSLRAVSSATGEVLASVIVEKPIASTRVRGGVFTFVRLDELLEIEAGTAANEPRQIALRMAIEHAVVSLIMEGADAGLWDFADRHAGAEALRAHRSEMFRETSISPERRRRQPPDTRNAASVVQTRPVARPTPQIQQRQLMPRQEPSSEPEPSPPPPARDGEVLG